jgi:hypothetical protein
MKTITNTIYPAFALFAFACFALAPLAQAVDPAPDGGYSGGNTAEGDNALLNLTTGTNNVAVGFEALVHNDTGINNTACGGGALHENTGGESNTGIGNNALFYNTTGDRNTAVGVSALQQNTNTANNTAIGWGALASNFGFDNTAAGSEALGANQGAGGNSAFGRAALQRNSLGSSNTGVGYNAIGGNFIGSTNTAVGYNALGGISQGNNNVALGYEAGQNLTSGNSNNIHIGNPGLSGGENGRIRIGTGGTHTATFIAGIRGVTVPSGVGVIIGTNQQLGTVQSSKRFKEAIKPMDKASESILALKPVTFRYKHELDPDRIPQFGLVAEDVEKVNPDLVVRDENGNVSSVRYEAVNAMLLNEFLKEHRAFVKQQRELQEQGATIARQQKQIDVLTTGLQQVSAQLELSKPEPQTVVNNR